MPSSPRSSTTSVAPNSRASTPGGPRGATCSRAGACAAWPNDCPGPRPRHPTTIIFQGRPQPRRRRASPYKNVRQTRARSCSGVGGGRLHPKVPSAGGHSRVLGLGPPARMPTNGRRQMRRSQHGRSPRRRCRRNDRVIRFDGSDGLAHLDGCSGTHCSLVCAARGPARSAVGAGRSHRRRWPPAQCGARGLQDRRHRHLFDGVAG